MVDKQALIDALTEQMNKRIVNYRQNPEDELALLNYMRAFYKYSMRNTLLIEAQYRGAYGVASYKEHQKNGYHVQKGQKAIRILAPNRQDMFIDEKNVKRPLKYATKIQKQKIKDQKLKVIKSDLRGYIPVPVFDITQTDCPPADYPKLYPNRPENFEFNGTKQAFTTFYQAVISYAHQKKVGVSVGVMKDGAQKGFYVPDTHEIVLRQGLTEQEQAKVLLHELAHADMHTHKKMAEKDPLLQTRAIKEYQAEMMAYLVSSSFELDTEDYSTTYLKRWTSKEQLSPEVYLQSLDEVKATASTLMNQIVGLYNERTLAHEQAPALTDPPSFQHYLDTLYRPYEQTEIVVFLNEQAHVQDSRVLPQGLERDEKITVIHDHAHLLNSKNIAYVEKDVTQSNPTELALPLGLIAIEKALTKSHIQVLDYFLVTKDSVHSHQFAKLIEKKKPEPSPLKKLLEKPVDKQINIETDTLNQKKANDKNKVNEKVAEK